MCVCADSEDARSLESNNHAMAIELHSYGLYEGLSSDLNIYFGTPSGLQKCGVSDRVVVASTPRVLRKVTLSSASTLSKSVVRMARCAKSWASLKPVFYDGSVMEIRYSVCVEGS